MLDTVKSPDEADHLEKNRCIRKNSALIVVDVQNDFLPGGALAVEKGDQVIAPLNALMPLFTEVVATVDYHPGGHLSFASSHPGHEVGEVIDVDGINQILWPDHCVAGTFGSELSEELLNDPITKFVVKGTDLRLDSYSAFFDNEHRASTGLTQYLRGQGIEHLYIGGLALDYCVKATALDALDEGFGVTLITDATRAVEVMEGDGKRAIEELRSAGARIMTTKEVLSCVS